jgi:hypothetical protein
MVEIKSIELAPFTLMSSSVQAILAFIMAIIMLIVFSIAGAVIPQIGAAIALIGVAMIVIYPISAFFIGITANFFTAFLYNALVSRLGGVKLELEGNDITAIPVVPFALILSVIEAIWAFIIGLFLAAAAAPIIALLSSSIPVISQAIANATNTTGAAMPTGAALGSAGVVGALLLIIGLPIAVFIFGFIGHALAAIFYNYIATRAANLKLEFAKVSDTLHELKTIPVVPAALSIAIVFTIFGLIQGIIRLISFSAAGDATAGVVALISDIIGNFIMYFIFVALAAWIYNFLVPKIGGIKLDLE